MRWLAVLALLPAVALAEHGRILVDEVVRVYDGDTITVSINQWPPLLGNEIGVRVNGIDTPEIRGNCPSEMQKAREARDLVKSILANAEQIELRNLERGKYFRIVADVYVDGQSLADHVMEANLAYRYDGGTKQRWCPL